MELNLKQKKNIVDFARNFSSIAKKEGWISNYDTETDTIAVRVPRLSSSAQKKYVNDEFAFYLNRDNKVEGVFIEYFMTNFVTHLDDVKDLKKELTKEIKRKGEDSSVVTFKTSETKKIVPELESVLINSFITSKREKLPA
jgi:hypothetical protein